MRLPELPWPQLLLVISACLSGAAGVLLVVGGESIGYAVVVGSVVLAGVVLTDVARHWGRRD